MSTRKAVGALLVATPFAAILGLTLATIGWLGTALIVIGAAAMIVLVVGGVALLVSD